MTDDDLIQQMINMSRLLQTDRQCMVSILRLVREHDAKHRAVETEKPRRVPVQIIRSDGETWCIVNALANDGTLWELEHGKSWSRLPDLPQD